MALEQFNAKVYPEALKLFNELMEESGSQTRGKFIDLLLENYQNPRKVVGINEVEQAMIIDLKQQIETLINEKLDLDERNIKLESDLNQNLNLLSDYAIQLQNSENRDINTRLNPDQVIMNLEPHVKFFIDEVLKQYEKKGKSTTAGPMLLNLFWNYILHGAGDYLPVIFDNGYVRAVLERFRKEKIMRQEAAQDGN